ncbi:MAG: ATP-dependent zinc metalloprotease FtsH [Chloroflexi bacterium]|nr:ATP-dependent zinc metalloprotease FtsH [Chloroflexota bacterium]
MFTLAFCVGGFIGLLILRAMPPQPHVITINDLARLVKDGDVSAINLHDGRATAQTLNGQQVDLHVSQNESVPSLLASFGVTPDELAQVDYVVDEPSPLANWLSALPSLLPLIFFGAILLLFLRQARGANGQALSLTKSGARRFQGSGKGIRFQDVAGVEEAIVELQEVVEFLKQPQKFAALGARIPQGILLVGPPGTGKTLLSRALAGEAGVPFFSISGSEFVELFVGVGASRVRDLFAQARASAPCIVFVDEIDAVGRRRGDGRGGGNQEHEQTLNQILVEMDGFDSGTNVIVIAATNRPDVLDTALMRPGRFDRQVVLRAPDINGRKAILEVHASGKPLDRSVELSTLAKATPGFSGADLANLINEGAILAARRNKESIGMCELEEAIDRVIAGPECKSRLMSHTERLLTAYHESGHAVAMRYLEHHDPVQKVTIMSRGSIGGYTRPLPPEDRHYMTRRQLRAMLAAALGGHAAEQVVFGDISTGAENDIQKASAIARKMVTHYGMSEGLGTIALGRNEELNACYSEKTAEAIDQEVRRLLDDAHARAVSIITEHREAVDRLASALLEYETLDGDNLERVLRDETPRK